MQPVYSVKEFNELVNVVLNESVGEVTVKGEVSGFQIRQGKWVSFDLKDEGSVLNCFTMAFQLDMPIQDGQEVMVTGTPRVYVPYGKYSFTVRQVQLTGEGALKKAYEELKAKLAAEGLFNPEHKRPLPRFPHTIGIITSGEGAAVNDILKVINGRWGGLKIYLAPVLVQGKNAPDSLVAALNYFNQHHPVDVILFGRGGGSMEDLQAFNSERVARAIFASRIPVVAGIGHEHNTSIADLVADVRAATPSNAAEIAVPDRMAVAHEIGLLKTRTEQIMHRHLTHAKHALSQHKQTLQLFIQGRIQRIRLLIQRVHQGLTTQTQLIAHRHAELKILSQKVTLAMKNNLEQASQRLAEKQKLLQVLNPTSILGRGYSITYQAKTGKPITSLADLPADGRIKTQIGEGTFESIVPPPTNQTSLF